MGSLLPDAGASQREEFRAAYGSEHEGRDTADHFGNGMVPTAGADYPRYARPANAPAPASNSGPSIAQRLKANENEQVRC